MILIIVFTLLLVSGMAVSQGVDLSAWREYISVATIVCLAYIMIEVGLEFTIDRSNWKNYLKDFWVAMAAAIFPAVLCMVYFIAIFPLSLKEAALVGISTAPTSAGILFSMLLAAGLGATWVFQKARNLAIFDDLGTLLLLIPLKIWITGFHMELVWVILILIFLGTVAVRWQKCLRIPVGKGWLFAYGVLLTGITTYIERTAHIHLEILFPAFILGSLLCNKKGSEDHETLVLFDRIIKGLFMFLVGCSLPKIMIGNLNWFAVSGHIVVLMLLSNLGKCFPIFAYRKTVSFRERLALSIAMFPRGEVGAGVLLIALGYGINGLAVGIAVLTLALNLICTGFFIVIVMKLIGHKGAEKS